MIVHLVVEFQDLEFASVFKVLQSTLAQPRKQLAMQDAFCIVPVHQRIQGFCFAVFFVVYFEP